MQTWHRTKDTIGPERTGILSTLTIVREVFNSHNSMDLEANEGSIPRIKKKQNFWKTLNLHIPLVL